MNTVDPAAADLNRAFRLLLVDDNPADARLLSELLREAGDWRFELEHATCLHEAVGLAGRGGFDVALLDLSLPDSQGLRTLEVFRKGAPALAVVVLTGNQDERLAVQAVLSGAQDYLVKGCADAALLVRTIRHAIERNRVQEAVRRSEREWRHAFGAINDGVCTIDNDGTIRRCNPAMETILGKSRGDIVGATCYRLVHGLDEHHPDCPLVRARSSRRRESMLMPCGDRWLEVTVDPVIDEQNMVTSFVHVIADITERKRTEMALAESERSMAVLLSNLPGMAYRCLRDEHWTMLFVSQGVRELTGYAAEQLTHNRHIAYNDVIHPDDRLYVRHEVDAAADERRPFSLQYRIVHADGAVRWVQEMGRQVRPPAEGPGVLEGFMNDVTERKHSEERERHLHSVLRAIRNVNQLITKEKDRGRLIDGACRHLNEARQYHGIWIALFDADGSLRVSAQSHVAGRWPALETGLRKGIRPECVRRALETKGLIVVDNTAAECGNCPMAGSYGTSSAVCGRLAYGEQRYGVVCVGCPPVLSGDEQELSLLQEVIDDISFALYGIDQEEKRAAAEARVRKNAEDLAYLARSAVGFVDIAPEQDIHRYIGEHLRELVRGDCAIVVTELDHEQNLFRPKAILGLVRLLHALRTTAGVDPFEMAIDFGPAARQGLETGRLCRLDGGLPELVPGTLPGPVMSVAQAALGARHVYVIGFVREGRIHGGVVMLSRRESGPIDEALVEAFAGQAAVALARRQAETALRQSEAALRQTQKMEAIGVLAGGIAHDFNNILGAIIGYSDLALAKTDPDSGVHANIEQVVAAGKRAADLVRQILTFSRQTTATRQPLDIRIVVNEALKLLRPTLPSTIQIEQDIERDTGKVIADPTQMHQVLMNLCTNASHAMRGMTGTLTVRLHRTTITAGSAHPRLPPGPYVRLSVGDTGKGMDADTLEHIFEPFFTTKEQGEGTGMGLSVVHGIVRACNGDITVESTPGKGTRFDVLLPTVERPDEAAAAQQGAAPHGSGERVLLVDDERFMVELGTDILRSSGYRVTPFGDSAEAARAFSEAPGDYDLLVTDMTMPDMTGLQLARHCLELRPELPVVLCTGFSDVVTPENAAGYGIREYVSKPVSPEEMRRVVWKALHGA